MNSNYVAEIQSTSIPNEQLVSGDMFYCYVRLSHLNKDYLFRHTYLFLATLILARFHLKPYFTKIYQFCHLYLIRPTNCCGYFTVCYSKC